MNTPFPLRGSSRWISAAVLGLGAVLGACSSQPVVSADPLSDVRTPGLSEDRRLLAVDRSWDLAITDPSQRDRVRSEFKKDIFLLSTGDSVRKRMVEKLLSDTDPEGLRDTQNFLRLRLPTEPSREIVELVCRESAERSWVAMTPSLVRSYARRVPGVNDADRPERAALMRLHPGKEIEEIVYDVFVGAAASAPAGTSTPKVTAPGKDSLVSTGASGRSILEEKVQTDAWELLVRLDRDGSRRAALFAGDTRLSDGPGRDPLLADLKAAASQLRAVPLTGPELEWIRMLRAEGNTNNAKWWRAASAAVARLTPEQATGLEIRHAEPVRWAAANRPEWLAMTREQLRDELTSRLRGRKTYSRDSERNDPLGSPPATIPAWDPKLSWGDLLTILVLDTAISDPGVRAALFEQANEDRANRATEYGGALESVWPDGDPTRPAPSDGSGGVFEARLYLPHVPPRLPNVSPEDTRFVASEQMLSATTRALAHYHFHVQHKENEAYAGPSSGDMEYAASYARNCLVFTSIRDGVLNADYYQRNGAKIDLGEVRR